jgi:excisionase family DNA binding protein
VIDDTLQIAPGHLTVAQAAERLGVTPTTVRALISAGVLPAKRLGHAWMIPSDAVELRRSRGSRHGRRFVPANAWALLFMAADMPAPWVDRHDRWRLRRYLETHRLIDIRAQLIHRGQPRSYRAHPGVVTALRTDPTLMLTGSTGASEARLGLVGGGGEVDAYVAAEALATVVHRHHLRPTREPNVTLRVVPDFGVAWPPLRIAPIPAIALDLLDSQEPRAQQVGTDLLTSLDDA